MPIFEAERIRSGSVVSTYGAPCTVEYLAGPFICPTIREYFFLRRNRLGHEPWSTRRKV